MELRLIRSHAVVALVIGLSAAACTAAPPATQPPGPPPTGTAASPTAAAPESPQGTMSFTIASTSYSIESVPLLAALDELREQGYQIEYPALTAADLVAEGMIRNDFQFGVVGLSAAIVAIQAGAPITNIMTQVDNPWLLYAATDIEACEDLGGRPFAIHSQEAFSTALGNGYVATECPGTEPEYLIISGSENRYAAMIAGEVDASVIGIADAVALEEEAGDRYHQLATFAETLPELIVLNYAANSEWASENPETVATFLAAVLEQHRRIADEPGYFEQLVETYQDDIGGVITEGAIERYAELYPVDGGFTEERVNASLDFLAEGGFIEPGSTATDVADFSYLAAALESLDN